MLKQWKERLRLLSIMDGLVPRRLWLGGALLACLTVLMGMALLGLSGWFITATALAGLLPAVAQMFDVFMPSAGIRLLAVGRTGARYAERLVTHDATLAALASLRVKLFSHWAGSSRTARALLLRPARLLQRLTADVDALDIDPRRLGDVEGEVDIAGFAVALHLRLHIHEGIAAQVGQVGQLLGGALHRVAIVPVAFRDIEALTQRGGVEVRKHE